MVSNEGGLKDISELREIRVRLVDRGILASLFVAFPLVASSVGRILVLGFRPIMLFHISGLFIVIALVALRRRLPYGWKVGIFTGFFFSLGVWGLVSFGIVGGAVPILLLTIYLMTVMFDLRHGLIALAACLFCFAGTWLLYQRGTLHYDFDVLAFARSPSSWLNLGVSMVAYSFIIIYSLGRLQGSLLDSLTGLKRREVELQASNDRLILEIRERERIEAERLHMEEQLRQSQKMEAVGRLAGGMAHDFNNILTAITGHVSLALLQAAPADPIQERLTEVKKAADRATALVRQLLAFSRKEIIAPRALDLNALIASMHSMLSRLIGEDIHLVFSPQSGLGLVHADPVQLEQVVLNLVVNARDAMPDGGLLTIETRNEMLVEGPCAPPQDARPGSVVVLSIRDSGVGMNAEVKSHLFEPFFTTKPKGQGTGLGLAMVFGAVQQNRGWINVCSEPGRGTRIDICLPRFHACVADPIADKNEEKLSTGQETILLVEDDHQVRRLGREFLSHLGYRVFDFTTGEEALHWAGGYPGPIDLLLTDVVMPGMNGPRLAKTLSGQRPDVKVLFTSGYTENAVVHQGVLDEGIHFIPKPFSLPSLSAQVRKVLGPRAS